MRWAGRLAGVRLPGPQHVPLDEPAPIVRWMAEVLRRSPRPTCSPLPAPWCVSARRRSRPGSTSPAPLHRGRRAGDGDAGGGDPTHRCRGGPRYAIIECSAIGHGCLPPRAREVHFLSDLHALIQRGPDVDVPALPPGALFLSSLRLSAPYVLLDASMGDEAVVSERRCGCPLERLGWMTHLETIPNYES